MKLKVDPLHVLAATGVAAVGVLLYAATRTTGPVNLPAFTELRSGPLQEHLVTAEELLVPPGKVRIHYPGQVAPGITNIVQKGFAPLYCIPDPQVAALPAEKAW